MAHVETVPMTVIDELHAARYCLKCNVNFWFDISMSYCFITV